MMSLHVCVSALRLRMHADFVVMMFLDVYYGRGTNLLIPSTCQGHKLYVSTKHSAIIIIHAHVEKDIFVTI